MAVPHPAPLRSSSFVVDCGVTRPEFSSAELPEATVDVTAYRGGSGHPGQTTEQPGAVTYGRLVLRRPIMPGDLDLWRWWKETRDGAEDVGREVVVSLLDSRQEPVAAWVFSAAFPAAYRISPLDATSDALVMETVELAFDTMEARS